MYRNVRPQSAFRWPLLFLAGLCSRCKLLAANSSFISALVAHSLKQGSCRQRWPCSSLHCIEILGRQQGVKSFDLV
ncbi:hypothetical protein EDC04DRAFT_2706322, partial [Pisolithus marmoratus]